MGARWLETDQDFVSGVAAQRFSDKGGGLVEMRGDPLSEAVGQPHVQFLDVVHLGGEGWVEVYDGDDVGDAEGCGHGWVLGGVEIAEVESGDDEVWVTEGGFLEGSVHVHDFFLLFVVEISEGGGGRKDGLWAGGGGRKTVGEYIRVTPPVPK